MDYARVMMVAGTREFMIHVVLHLMLDRQKEINQE